MWRRAVVILSASLVALFAGGNVLAHATLVASEPAANTAVDAPLDTAELRFSEGLELAFSTFKVYRIDAEVDLSADDAARRLNALAALLITAHNGQQPDGDGLVAAQFATPGDKALVEITFDEPLGAGHYVVMWRVLSVDTHVVDGHVVFSVTE